MIVIAANARDVAAVGLDHHATTDAAVRAGGFGFSHARVVSGEGQAAGRNCF